MGPTPPLHAVFRHSNREPFHTRWKIAPNLQLIRQILRLNMHIGSARSCCLSELARSPERRLPWNEQLCERLPALFAPVSSFPPEVSWRRITAAPIPISAASIAGSLFLLHSSAPSSRRMDHSRAGDARAVNLLRPVLLRIKAIMIVVT